MTLFKATLCVDYEQPSSIWNNLAQLEGILLCNFNHRGLIKTNKNSIIIEKEDVFSITISKNDQKFF